MNLSRRQSAAKLTKPPLPIAGNLMSLFRSIFAFPLLYPILILTSGPKNTPIPSEVITHIHEAFNAEKVSFPCQVGDVSIIDNMLASHAREPFTGDRRVVV